MRYPTPALQRVRVIDVHDGDSIRVEIDRGFDDSTKKWIRLKDVWAPESYEEGGPECRNFVLGWLLDHNDGSEWPFLLETFRTPKSDTELKTFERFVGVLSASDKTTLNKAVSNYVAERGYGGGIGS